MSCSDSFSVKISIKQEENNLSVLLEDNSFYLSEESRNRAPELMSWLNLNLNQLESIVESIGGTMKSSFGIVKTALITLPYEKQLVNNF